LRTLYLSAAPSGVVALVSADSYRRIAKNSVFGPGNVIPHESYLLFTESGEERWAFGSHKELELIRHYNAVHEVAFGVPCTGDQIETAATTHWKQGVAILGPTFFTLVSLYSNQLAEERLRRGPER